ncbi:hypothetical protein TWF106_007780 [Orbilia oligospora]|uniref:Uncharacterized protein n=1 Tax=Orbilia oligospora TaxID=2813651 RepID=A0A6G1M5R7_ORBOL|nr:hypothetical protein TWF788_010461 [Orbilia oligospora]KAF3204842.1 hypothetical protein TWF679_009514 [Orbilia oligospora]KAF3218188.1 hypothetical protein TWF106_007780 [Orbilia oligospora]KAF3221206.1 hypothetical protein TWF191_007174 [Orbilia oligospora]KAF3246157.1 hypothetical protein TWF192_007002 [Orbilia oligospora]
MDAAGISKTLDAMMTSPHVIGALIIDSTSGLCLGSRGKATEADATYLTIAARSALKKDSIGAVLHKDSYVMDILQFPIVSSCTRSVKGKKLSMRVF